MATLGGRSALKRLLALACGFALVAPVPLLAAEGPESHPKTIVDPITGAEMAAGRLLVAFRHDLAAAQRTAIRQHEGLKKLASLELIGAELVDIGSRPLPEAIEALERWPEVEYAHPDYVLRLLEDPTAEPFFGELWGLHNTGQPILGQSGLADVDVNGPQAALLTSGDPTVVVAVIDDGVDFTHPDLAGRAWVNPGESGGGKETNGIDDDGNGYVDDVHGWNFYGGNNNVHGSEQEWHGTHVAGTIAASLDGSGVVGVAPNVKIMALKFIGPNGEGTIADAILALQYAKAKGVKISNNSYGGGAFVTSHRNAIQASGMLFVAAAGNNGNTGAVYPAAYDLPNIVSVAAVDNQGELASFSNYGQSLVHISAPGRRILSAVTSAPGNPPAWAYVSGTSMAAPHASGAAALAASTIPSLLNNPSAFRDHLLATGKPAPKTVGKTATGRMIDAWGAANPFEDIVNSSFRYDISWIYGKKITGGCAQRRYCPTAGLTRGQAASMLARALKLSPASDDYFDDDNGTTHEADINRLAKAGLTTGCGTRLYCPDQHLTRGQLASLLSRALSLPSPLADYFDDDDGTTHEADINRLAQAGIASGCAPSKFCHADVVNRGQIAAFLRRALAGG